MLKFLLLGFVLICAPLFMALFLQNAGLKDLAAQSSASVQTSSEVARLAPLFYLQAGDLERYGQRYTLTEIRALLDQYDHARQQFHATCIELQKLLPEQNESLSQIHQDEEVLYERLHQISEDDGVKAQEALIDDLGKFVKKTRAMQEVADNFVLASVNQLLDSAEKAQKKWQFLLYVSLLIAVILSIFLSIMISRPVLALDRAIRQLGGADFSQRIHVRGTEDFRYLGERLEWLRARLQMLEDQKNLFLRNMSHELKTPLTSIREGSELLRDGVCGNLKQEQQEIVEIVHENTLALQKMIENLLDYHQVQSQGSKLDKVAAGDLSELVKKVAEEHRLIAQRRGVSFDLSLFPVKMTFDERKTASILDNLISNAIKFSPNAGKIKITLTLVSEGVRIDVMDEGPGIPKEDREKVFESFYQGAQPEDGVPIKGSGLGLAIAREYALAHQGSIEAGDRHDGIKGARFTLWLPKNTVI
ncbi:MAG: hypothetical protein LBG61_06320 [Burkholderiales bacterium]|jgi:two-component system sensor histidine kinase GlrK|nr:hypothetical protein [Burkholderiales bacterium]